MPMIGDLDSPSPEGVANRLRGLRHGLKESGYIENERLAIAYRCSEGQSERLPDWRPSTTHYGSIFTANSAPLEPEAAQSYSFRERGIPPRQSSSLQSAIFMGD